MSARIFLIIVLICMVVFIAYTARQVVCNPPYIPVGRECCLDYNNNSICDRDEVSVTASTYTTTSTVDVCAAYTGPRREECVREENRKNVFNKCINLCDTLSLNCREGCKNIWLSGEKDACISKCFEEYRKCSIGCGEKQQQT